MFGNSTSVDFRGIFCPIKEVLTQLAKRQARKCRRRVAENWCGKAALAKLNIASYYIAKLAKIIRRHFYVIPITISAPTPIVKPEWPVFFVQLVHGITEKGISVSVELYMIFVTQL